MISYNLEKEHRSVGSYGVTLIELLVVIGLMAILMAIAIPRLDLIQTSSLNGAARVVWSDMHHAKMTAIKENRNISVVFNGDGYYLEREIENDTNEIFFTRNISDDYPGVSISKSYEDPLLFYGKGTAKPPSQTISINLGNGESKSFTVISSGRIGRIL